VLAVGDSLRTDIAGATGADLAACWALDGIHGATLADGSGGFDHAKVDQIASDAGLNPVASIPRFVW
jgi:ribonucleotide monophosphatase NagD (HAD superfamily)